MLFSVAPDYYRSAVAELRRTLPVAKIQRVGEDAGIVYLGSGGQETAVEASMACDLRFVRHLAGVDAVVNTSELNRLDAEEVADWAADAVLDRLDAGDEVSLHVWDSGDVSWAPGKIRRPLLEVLLDNGIRVVTSNSEQTVSVCVGEERTTVGLSPSGLGLCDWAGGRIRLANRKEQVSRAEFKLEELFGFIGPPSGKVAIDLGASPGGWTRILRSHGFERVYSVDPADLDPRILADDEVHHHRTTAGEFIAAYKDSPVDMIVNDMRMVPHMTAITMVDAADILRPGGQVVVTFKLGTTNPVKQADESLETLAEAYEPTFIRQLQHNRHELTVVATRR
ncbi:ribosomal RNA large subunit methyltransferase J [Luteipulveratus mongoliensis]|uniref:Ribosomal RNA large subunit methyltransferase J n=1 Tax=Luteipulveratus mongoliensis TaxID=571913 RepID=A0A0K1JNJ7_9MICO|nr:ribosomal RNA large subunit methyltransferase J [Luteipulveratus mongoliensis]